MNKNTLKRFSSYKTFSEGDQIYTIGRMKSFYDPIEVVTKYIPKGKIFQRTDGDPTFGDSVWFEVTWDSFSYCYRKLSDISHTFQEMKYLLKKRKSKKKQFPGRIRREEDYLLELSNKFDVGDKVFLIRGKGKDIINGIILSVPQNTDKERYIVEYYENGILIQGGYFEWEMTFTIEEANYINLLNYK
jgi:hypothetical protein